MKKETLIAFSARLNAALDAIGFPEKGRGRQTALSAKMGVSQKGARKWLEAETMPEIWRLERLADVAHCSVAYLLGQDMPALPGNVTSGKLALTLHVEPGGTSRGPSITGRVPLITWRQAADMNESTDMLAPDVAQDWIPTTAPINRQTYALTVRGDIMETVIPDGSIVIVEPALAPRDGDYVIVRSTESAEASIKQLVHDGDERLLRPANPRYPIRPLGNATIVGVVRALERVFR